MSTHEQETPWIKRVEDLIRVLEGSTVGELELVELVETMAVRAEASPSRHVVHALRLSGTLPPLSASFVITCVCSHMFISAEPSSAPV